MKRNYAYVCEESGFSVPELVLAAVLMAVIGMAILIAYGHLGAKPGGAAKSTPSSAANAGRGNTDTSVVSVSPSTSLVVLQQFGVQFDVPKSVGKLTFVSTGPSTEDPDVTVEFDNGLCPASEPPGTMGSLTRSTDATKTESDEEVSPDAQIGDYYYYYSTPQENCTGDDKIVAKQNQDWTLMRQAMKSLAAN